MSQTVTQAFIEQFNTNVYLLSQQIGSKVVGKVRQETCHAKKGFIDRLAPTFPVRRVSRHQDTPLVEQIHSRRAYQVNDWVLADLVDDVDKMRMLISPESLYAQNFARGMGREQDYTFIRSLIADSESGQFGGTFTDFPAGNTIASAGAGLTISRVRQAKRILDEKVVEETGRLAIVSVQAMEDLLESTEVISSDYNTVKALVQGTIEGNTWMGFEWIVVPGASGDGPILPIDGSLDRSCFFIQRDGVAFVNGMPLSTSMDSRPDKLNSMQILSKASFGGVRVDDDCVLVMLVREV